MDGSQKINVNKLYLQWPVHRVNNKSLRIQIKLMKKLNSIALKDYVKYF